MFRKYDLANGLPIRIYREPAEIKRDIIKINSKIEEMRDMINIRSLIMDILVRKAGGAYSGINRCDRRS